ncbi:MAG: hypothetical protein ACM35G_00895 [Planctomycetaceae bacterium]
MEPISFVAAFALSREPVPAPVAGPPPAAPAASRPEPPRVPIRPDPAPPAGRAGGVRGPIAPQTSWRLADADGQEWTHPDRAALERWVAGRNAALAAARRPFPPAPAGRGACPGGRCSR